MAPKDDLIPVEAKTPEEAESTRLQPAAPQNNSDTNFTAPSGWGTATATSQTKIELPEYPSQDDSLQENRQESGLVRFVKIFLIAVALILLGVLLGVLASNFLTSPKPTSNVQIPSSITPSASPSSQLEPTPVAEPEYSKKIEYRNIGSGPYSFDLLLSDDWKIASKSTEPKNLNIDIENQSLFAQIIYNSKQGLPKPNLCLLPEEIAPKNIPYIKYQKMDELKVEGLSWLLVKNLTSTQSASYLVCEQNNNNQYTNLTSIGFISFGLNTGEEITTNHKNTILKLFNGLKILNSSPSASFSQ